MAAQSDVPEVLVVDDEPGLRQVLELTLRRRGYRVTCKPGVKSALRMLEEREDPYPLVITDLVMPDGSGIDVLNAARARSHETQVIVITAFSTVESAIEAMRLGAYDFVTKPFSPAELAELAGKALEKSSIVTQNRQLRARLATLIPDAEQDDTLLGQDPAMRKITQLVRRAASTRATVLITGESGTGKERTARVLHELSSRADGPFCVINCGALPEALMESELFGHEKGAFTGATGATIGLFRQADGGTLLLDEIGELPLALQVKLLRVLQERKVRPVGSSTELEVDVRVLAATNRDVDKDVDEERFRKDLFYRLNVIRIELPPLRERRSDIPKLARAMIRRFSEELGNDVAGLSSEAVQALERYHFPGNIRELENIIERAVALASSSTIGLDDLPEEVSGRSAKSPPGTIDLPEDGCHLDEVLERTERRLLDQALERTDGVRTAAAKLLGISFRSLRYRLNKLGMDSDDKASDDDGSGDDGSGDD
jgi:two-component system response regulator PilR (NtrC family)